jgi:hypothetical protein
MTHRLIEVKLDRSGSEICLGYEKILACVYLVTRKMLELEMLRVNSFRYSKEKQDGAHQVCQTSKTKPGV